MRDASSAPVVSNVEEAASAERPVGPRRTRRFPLGCDPRLKLGVATVGWLLVLSASHPARALFIALFAWGSLVALRLGVATLLRSLASVLFTGLVTVLLRVVLTDGVPWVHINWLGCSLTISAEGVHEGSLLGGRILGAVAVGAWLTATTPLVELERAFSWLGVPAPLLEIFALAHRYVSVLRETLTTAQSAQSLRLGYRNVRASLESAGVLAGLVMGRAIDQAMVTGQAMQLRGYRTPQRHPFGDSKTEGNLLLVGSALAAFGASVVWSGRWAW
jgi:cobalt/nickel transport system permease protein